jgi:iron complex outermembrane receptor protein
MTCRDNRNGPGGVSYQPQFNTSSVFDGRIDTLQARADFAPVRWNLFALGYEFENEEYKNISTDQNPDPAQKVDATARARQRSNAVFFQNQTRMLAERLQLHVSGRYQTFSVSRPQFEGGAPRYEGSAFPAPADALTGDASLSYFIPKTSTKLRAHAGNGYRAPSLYERIGTSFFFGAFSPLGDPGLRPERTVSFDTGVDQYFAGDRFRAGGTYFYTRLQEVIGYMSLAGDPWGRYGGYANTGGGLARGVEVLFEARPSRGTQMQASYTYTNADERRSALVGGMLQSIRVFPHALTLQATQQVTRRLQVAADFLGASDYASGSFFTGSGNRPYLFEGPRKLDLSANYTVPVGERKTLRFTLRVENALNREFYEDGFRTPRTWATAGMKFLF